MLFAAPDFACQAARPAPEPHVGAIDMMLAQRADWRIGPASKRSG